MEVCYLNCHNNGLRSFVEGKQIRRAKNEPKFVLPCLR